VTPDQQVSQVAAANPGRDLVLAPGTHRGVVVDRRMTLRADAGAIVEGPVEIDASGVRVEGLVVRGGSSGFIVRAADDVVLDHVDVASTELHGIEVVDAAAHIRSCSITGLTSPHAQGIEVRSSGARAHTVIDGCRIDGGQEGVITHVSWVEIRDNEVTGTTMRGIAVSEMSEGIIERNRVHDARGNAIYCGDMSHCEIRENEVRAMSATPGGPRMASGQAVVGWYYSTLRLRGNDVAVSATPAVDVYSGSITTDRFPLTRWPPGWRGALPAAVVVGIGLAVLVALRVLLAPLTTWLRRRHASRRAARIDPSLGWWALGVVIAVQGFHVIEHAVQVFQVYVADAEQRSGLVGQHVDTEWLHFAFNVTVLGGIAVVLWLARGDLLNRTDHALTWLLAGTAVQVWHVTEHVARVIQYVRTGLSPAPGIIGDDFGLIWFHFGINVPVIVGLAMATLVITRSVLQTRVTPASSREPRRLWPPPAMAR
jgi:hypothetical protein